MSHRIALPLVLAGALFVSVQTVSAQEKVYTSLTTDQMEQILKGMKLDFKKTPSPVVEGVFLYDIARDRYTMRLHFFKGKDLMVDALFKETTLDNVNRWNMRTRFNRAVRYVDPNGKPFVALESNLDLAGGVSENAIRRFLQTFEKEVPVFEKFLGGALPDVAQIIQPGGDKVYTDVTSEKLESILQSLNLQFKKQALPNGAGFIYDYQSKTRKIRLWNYQGKDLMLDAVFEKQPLETINKYNFTRKFIRTVLYPATPRGVEYTALEANQDCTAGVTDNLLRYFIVTFDEEIESFVAFLNKK